MSEDLIETVADGVATLRLNRPDAANALSLEIFDDMLEALPRLGRDPSVRVIVITGAGRAFCAGGDVKSMKGRTQELTHEQRVDELQRKHGVIRALYNSPKVTISAINGAAAGAGLALAMGCDLRIAQRGARFATSFSNISFAGDFGGTFLLSRLIGTVRAQELYILNAKFDADEAYRMGLLTKVVDEQAFPAEVEFPGAYDREGSDAGLSIYEAQLSGGGYRIARRRACLRSDEPDPADRDRRSRRGDCCVPREAAAGVQGILSLLARRSRKAFLAAACSSVIARIGFSSISVRKAASSPSEKASLRNAMAGSEAAAKRVATTFAAANAPPGGTTSSTSRIRPASVPSNSVASAVSSFALPSPTRRGSVQSVPRSGMNLDPHESAAESRIARGDGEVARGGEREPGAVAISFNRGDDGFPAGNQQADQSGAALLQPFAGGEWSRLGETREIAARGEMCALTGEHDRPARGVLVEELQIRDQQIP